ncbi:MAG: TspO/MBR family protein [Tagaea sp.]
MTRRGRTAPLAAGAVCAVLVAGLGGAMTDVGPWYEALDKPAWQPPGWLFGPVWTVIFACCAWSFAEAWAAARNGAARATILWLFGFNMFLNVAWSGLFFAWQRPDWALIEVVLLWLSIAALILALRPVSARASVLLVPYLVWVSIAAFLNWEIVRLNGPFGA